MRATTLVAATVVVALGVTAGVAVREATAPALGGDTGATPLLSDESDPAAVPGPMRPTSADLATDTGATPRKSADAAREPARAKIPAVASAPAKAAPTVFEGKLGDRAGGRVVVDRATRELRFQDFTVDDAGDVEIWLVAADRIAPGDDVAASKHVSLGRLKRSSGNQTYRVPAELDVTVYRTVVLWSRRARSPRAAALLLPRRSS